ncbi:gephyrin-like molybdotransferase Glp [Isoalcanivorax indicus]|uniref:molybdopterin molybdotransferase MoeA n=1 Tax=Isoalcanivorax indicus TaxID=2202653 RepID=UPI000DBA6A9F|nr:gephyrin-like molybdotransferase Glp [Isoalcanivorax indicus]
MMTVSDAIERLLATVPAPPVSEQVPLAMALHRVLAEDVHSTVAVPPRDNSAVDGYAVRYAELMATAGPLPVSQRVPAGSRPPPLTPGTAARIFTGATVPEGADTVIMQEDSVVDDDGIRVSSPEAITAGAHIRRRGQDVALGSRVLAAGTRLSPRHIGLLGSVGLAQLPVFRRLRVAVLSTGDELVEPGEPTHDGQIYNSNRYLLCALLSQAGFEPVDMGRVEDRLDVTHAALCRAADAADLVLTTGGVSVGEEDHVRAAVTLSGTLDLWRVAIKPGKPFALGEVAGTPFMGLPGNPSAVLVTFMIMVLPWLRAAQGVAPPWHLGESRLRAGFALDRPGRRQEYLRVQVERDADGEYLRLHPNQSSGMLSSACWAHGLAVVPAGATVVEGEPLTFLRFED